MRAKKTENPLDDCQLGLKNIDGKLYGRTFGVQSLRLSWPDERAERCHQVAWSGGAAVALAKSTLDYTSKVRIFKAFSRPMPVHFKQIVGVLLACRWR